MRALHPYAWGMKGSPGGRFPVKYRQIADDLRAQLVEGRLKPGDQLPGQQELMGQWEVAMATVVRALDELRKEGLVATKPGLGTFVLPHPAPEPDVAAELAEVRRELAEVREQAREAPALERLGRIEANLMDLYGKTGFEYPREKPAQQLERKAAGE